MFECVWTYMKDIVEIWIQSILVWYAYMSLLPQIHQICSALQSTQLWCITSHKSSIPNPAPERYLGGSTGFVSEKFSPSNQGDFPKKIFAEKQPVFPENHWHLRFFPWNPTVVGEIHLTLSEKGLPGKKKKLDHHMSCFFSNLWQFPIFQHTSKNIHIIIHYHPLSNYPLSIIASIPQNIPQNPIRNFWSIHVPEGQPPPGW